MKFAVVACLCLSFFFCTICGGEARDVKVKGYTKKDGTKVDGYTREVKDPDTIKVKGYTKKDGTKVEGYERKRATK
jgi:hypothetical protein